MKFEGNPDQNTGRRANTTVQKEILIVIITTVIFTASRVANAEVHVESFAQATAEELVASCAGTHAGDVAETLTRV